MIAVLTSPFPLGGAPHRWLRPSAVGGLLQFSAWTGLPATRVMLVSELLPYTLGFANVALPTAAAEHVPVCCGPEHSSKSNAWPEQAGPLRRAQQLRVGRTARFVRHNRGAPNKKLLYDGLLGGLRQAHQAFRGQTGYSFLCFFNFFFEP
jgi:hypothetical protein